MADKTDAVSATTVRRSWFGDMIAARPLAFIVASILIGVGVTAIALFLSGSFADSDEAPIRVKNGSLEFRILDPDQQWQQAGTSGNWQIRDKDRYTNNFDVTVAANAGANCTGPLSSSGGTIRLSFTNNTGTGDSGPPAVVILQSPSKKTLVLPQGVTLNSDASNSPALLTYASAGYLSKIEVGASLGQLNQICSFTSREQLNSILILNLK